MEPISRRNFRDFSLRDVLEQEWLTNNTWCPKCQQADLGLLNPIEYETDGQIFIEGKCKICSTIVVSNITEG